MRIIVSFILLLLPTWLEVYKDRNGDVHPNHDWIFRGVLCLIVGFLLGLVSTTNHHFLLPCIKYTISSALLFAGIFPYWINFVQLKNGITTYAKVPKLHLYGYRLLSKSEVLDHVLNHLSDSAWPDKTKWWRSIGWLGRLIVNMILITIAVLLVV